MIEWLTAFIDVPDGDYDSAERFWTGVTETATSPPRGDRNQFVTLLPASGDAHLRMQRFGDVPRVHVDLHVADVALARDRAEQLGAAVVAEPGHVIMRSPAGLVFCFVSAEDHTRVSPLLSAGGPHRVDQLAIDVPASRFDDEARFWAELTEWPFEASTHFVEFARLSGSEAMPLCILLQRLGPDDDREHAALHLDISSGTTRPGVVADHVEHGAAVVADFERWTVMRDPAGLVYCITSRPPERPDDPS